MNKLPCDLRRSHAWEIKKSIQNHAQQTKQNIKELGKIKPVNFTKTLLLYLSGYYEAKTYFQLKALKLSALIGKKTNF